MINEQTDLLDLVRVETIKPSLFGTKIVPAHGFSREVFRQGTHIGSVRAPEDINLLAPGQHPGMQELKASTQDTLVTVNMGLRTLDLKGIFYTEDGYKPTYDVQLEIRVNNPLLFAQHYMTRSDPIALMKSAIVQEFNEYALRTLHENLSQTKLRYDALSHIQSKHVGVLVTQIYRSTIYSDEEFASRREREREADKQKHEAKLQAEVEGYRYGFEIQGKKRRQADEQDMQAAANDFTRQQDKINQQHQHSKNFNAQSTEKVLNHLLAQIDNQIDQGISVEEILENPLLQKHITPLLSSPERPALPAPDTVRGGTEIHQAKAILPSSENSGPSQDQPSPIPESTTGQYRFLDENTDIG